MICYGFTCRHIMVQSVYILNILTGQYESAKNELKENNKVLVIYLMLTLAGYFFKILT